MIDVNLATLIVFLISLIISAALGQNSKINLSR